MDSQILEDDNSIKTTPDKQCGEVYLSVEGNLTFLCTLCDMKFQGYQSYADHIMDIHYMLREADIPSPANSVKFEDDFQLLEDIEFVAPVPDNCSEIEEFVASFQAKESTENYQSLTKVAKASPTKTKILPFSKVGKYRCSKCQFLTKYYSVITAHIQRHLGTKRHFCTICNMGFYVPSQLRVHMRVHTGERPYLCQECGQTFKTNSALWRHAKRCKGIRDVECPECEKTFFDSRGLRYHMVVHSEERSYHCTECNSSFKLRKALVNHIKIHENKKEFKCQHCSASFNQSAGLISHVKNRHRLKENARE